MTDATKKPKSGYAKKRKGNPEYAGLTFVNRVFKYKCRRPKPDVERALVEALTTQCYLYNNALTHTQKAYEARQDDLAAYEARLAESNVVDRDLADDLARLLQESRDALEKARVAEKGPRGSQETFEKRKASTLKRLQATIDKIELWQSYAQHVGAELPGKVAEELRKLRVALWKRDHPTIDEYELRKLMITAPRHGGHPYLLKANVGVCQATLHRLVLAQAAQFRRFEAGEAIGDLHYKKPPRPGNEGQLGVWNCLEYTTYGSGNKFLSGVREDICSGCGGKGKLAVRRLPCRECPDYRKKYGQPNPKCMTCQGSGVFLDIPPTLRKMLGMVGDVEAAGSRYMIKKLAGTKATLPAGDHPCPLCNGKGKRTATWAKVEFSRIGELDLIDYRPLPEGHALRNVSVQREVDGWWVCLVAEIPFVPAPPNGMPFWGIDFGIKNMVTAYDGQGFHYLSPPGHLQDALEGDEARLRNHPCPRHRRASNKRRVETLLANGPIRGLSMILAEQSKGSGRRRQTRRSIALAHALVKNKRRLRHCNDAKIIALSAGAVAYEVLPVKRLTKRPAPIPADGTFPGETGAYEPNGAAAKSRKNQAFADAAPSAFIPRLISACERFGSRPLAVPADARTHAECGRTLNEDGTCPSCGPLTISPQQNSAMNAWKAGRALLGVEK